MNWANEIRKFLLGKGKRSAPLTEQDIERLRQKVAAINRPPTAEEFNAFADEIAAAKAAEKRRPRMGKITATERNELKRLIKARIERVRVEAKEYLSAEHERMDAYFQQKHAVPADLLKEVTKLRKAKADLAAKATALADRLCKAGCRGNYSYAPDKDFILNSKEPPRTSVSREAYEKWSKEQPSIYDIDRAAVRVAEQLQDELLCTALEGGDAKAFLAKIPHIPDLIAAAKKAK